MLRRIGEEACQVMGYARPPPFSGRVGQWRAGDEQSCEDQGQTVNVMLPFLGSGMAGNVFKSVRDPAGYELAMKTRCKEDKKFGG